MSDPQTPDLHHVALKRVQAKRGFQAHVVTYLVVNAFLWALWFFTSPRQSGFPWPAWVTLGWGVGVVMNGWAVYQRPVTEADVRREMDKLR